MKNGRSFLRITGVLVALAVLTVFAVPARVASTPSPGARADVIVIETIRAFGELEYPAAAFLHDQHTDALEKQGKSCDACHPAAKSGITGREFWSPKFKRTADFPDRQAMIDLYHQGCLGCHQETAGAGSKAGPVECRDCHQDRPRFDSNRLPLGFDLSLHSRHSKAAEEKCEKCHHDYDRDSRKLVYVKEKEGTCRYCHLEQPRENVDGQGEIRSMKQASHIQCLECHQSILAENKPDRKAGPVKCAGCHAPEAQAAFQKVVDPPRVKRNQPDAAIINIETDEVVGRMTPVPFDHKFHETKNDTCRVCHHASLDACVKCHTLTGSRESDGATLEQAMHQAQSDRSCLGCHAKRQQDKSCVGCHSGLSGNKLSDASCRDCHVKPGLPEGVRIPSDRAEEAALATTMLEARPKLSDSFKLEEVPEKVVIKTLSEKYEAVEMPHRKIVAGLSKDLLEGQLGQYFHAGEGVLCQGCHHNSPADKNPPRCASCHGRPFDRDASARPGLKGAYHQQCLDCHRNMGVAKPAPTACAECHKEKKS
ncbi:MAG: cytochrome c3 family protein [Pseudomonadota bacterium]